MADDVAVDDRLDRVALVLVERLRVLELHELAVHADAHEPLASDRVEHPVALGLAILDERPQHEEPRPFGQPEDLVHDLLDRLTLDLVALGTVRMADAGIEQPEVVVDLRDGADGGSRVPARTLLVDGDRRRQPVDLVDVRLLHLAEELAGIGRQALDVASLALGVDGVEGEAALAGAGQAGDDDETIARDRHRHVFQVVLAGTANDDLVLGHQGPILEQMIEMEHPFSRDGRRLRHQVQRETSATTLPTRRS